MRVVGFVAFGPVTAVRERPTVSVIPCGTEVAMSLSDRERVAVESLNASGRQPAVFVHGLWLLPGSWEPWLSLFDERGFAAMALDWPDDPATVRDALADPSVFAHKSVGEVAAHCAEVLEAIDRPPVLVGHSFGGLLVQKLAGDGRAAATVAVDPAPLRGVLPLPVSALKAAFPVLGNPANRGKAIQLTYDQWRFAFTNAVDDEEARQLYADFAVPCSGVPLFQAAFANVNPASEARVHTHNSNRGPLLIISGEKDNTVPWRLANAAYKRYKHNPCPTEITEIPDRGHSLVIDHGWQEVAEAALSFLERQGLPTSDASD
jgi:pimeloyl-ACP methyl ester carboxylesterase